MRLVFAGTPAAAVPSLHALVDAGHTVSLVITRPDAPQGRRRTLTPSPIAVAAQERGLPILRTTRLDADANATIAATEPDLGVIVAYGGFVREPLLSAPRQGWINLHFSLLPAWRGAAPVQRAIMAGDPEIGAGVFQLTPGLDEGDVYDEVRMVRDPDATGGELLDRLAREGAPLLAGVVDALAHGEAHATPQTGVASHAAKLTDADGAVDWERPAERVRDQINGVTPEPGAHTLWKSARFKLGRVCLAPDAAPQLSPGEVAQQGTGSAAVVIVGTATHPVRLTTVQPAGKAPMQARDWWNGQRGSAVWLGQQRNGTA